jgi:hypothetical protein
MQKRMQSRSLQGRIPKAGDSPLKKFSETKMKIGDLVKAFEARSLLPNTEYQRGASWKPRQKAAFVDSVFRGYPVPALFLQEKKDPGLMGVPTTRWEVVDGQQRLIALAEYAKDSFSTLGVEELSIPSSLQGQKAPWADRFFRDLDTALQAEFTAMELQVFMLFDNVPPDEVRDLFIRLQSGTALSRQQIRDAWPGELSSYVVHIAGKIKKRPRFDLFTLLDMRTRDADESDNDDYVPARQLCAQLLLTFFERRRGGNFPSLSASALDQLYHKETDFEPKGEEARDFEAALEAAFETLDRIRDLRNATADRKIRTFTRAQIIAVFVYFVEHLHRDGFDSHRTACRLAEAVNERFLDFKFQGRMKPRALEEWYVGWKRANEGAAVLVDAKRGWSAEERRDIRERDNGNCHRCGKQVDRSVEEIDHYPVAHVEGGRSAKENGRLVHWWCNRPGRPKTP